MWSRRCCRGCEHAGSCARGQGRWHEGSVAPGRHKPFEVDPRRTPLYIAERALFATGMWAWFRPKVVGQRARARHRTGDPGPGPPLLRRLRVRRLLHRPQALLHDQGRDVEEQVAREAAAHRRRLPGTSGVRRPRGAPSAPRRCCARDRCSCCSPRAPGGRARSIEDLMEGAAFLSARTGAPIVPVGIGGSDLAMPKGSAIPKPYTIQVVIGPAIPPPARTGGGRARVLPCTRRPRRSSRSCRRSTTRPRRRPAGTEARHRTRSVGAPFAP